MWMCGCFFFFYNGVFSLLHASFWFRFACVVSWLEILYLLSILHRTALLSHLIASQDHLVRAVGWAC
jgi:hypothetical protein